MAHHERALSENIAILLIAFLVILVTLIIIASLTGVLTKFLQKPAFMAVTASQFETSDGAHIISLYHQQGDDVNLNGTSQKEGVSTISLSVVDTGGGPHMAYSAPSIIGDDWDPGTTIYLYQSGGRYVYSDVAPGVGVASLPPGTYTVIITDDRAKVMLHSLPVTIS
jgi:hypothetical protein